MSTWVPESERDLKWKIWHQKFYVSVSNIQTRSADHIRAFGTPFSGDAIRDRAAANERLETYKSIADMVKLHHEGVGVALLRRSDAKIIFDLVMEYLSAWKRFIDTSMIHNPDAPYDDLAAMETFVNAVLPFAEEFRRPAELEESWLSKRISTIGGRTLQLKCDPPPASEPLQQGETPSQPKQTAAEKLFSNRSKRW